jgi:hypothetical protein
MVQDLRAVKPVRQTSFRLLRAACSIFKKKRMCEISKSATLELLLPVSLSEFLSSSESSSHLCPMPSWANPHLTH